MTATNSLYLILMSIFLLTLTSFKYAANSRLDPILVRHDKDEAEFIKIAERFEKYICHLNLPDCEGTIIADQWVISAAHCAVGIVDKFSAGRKHFIVINDIEIEVDKVVMHPSWMVRQVGDDDDIALLHLKKKPLGALQAKLYLDNDEVDKLVYMVGGGDKGNGLTGVNGNDGKQRGATNRIERATDKWLYWTFDSPNTQSKYLTEFEGISGPGDSGGPAFILKNDIVYLAGVSSGQDQKGRDEGLYGVEEFYTRVSHYIKWIDEEMAGNGAVSDSMFRVAPKPDAIDGRLKAIDIDDRILKQYVGEYEIQGITIKIYTQKNGTKLYSFVSDQPPFELIPTGEHEFHLRALDGYKIEFQNTKNGVFKELIATQPDGTYIAIRK